MTRQSENTPLSISISKHTLMTSSATPNTLGMPTSSHGIPVELLFRLPIPHEAVSRELNSPVKPSLVGKDGAAAILGLHPSTLRARMHKLGIIRPETKEPD